MSRERVEPGDPIPTGPAEAIRTLAFGRRPAMDRPETLLRGHQLVDLYVEDGSLRPLIRSFLEHLGVFDCDAAFHTPERSQTRSTGRIEPGG